MTYYIHSFHLSFNYETVYSFNASHAGYVRVKLLPAQLSWLSFLSSRSTLVCFRALPFAVPKLSPFHENFFTLFLGLLVMLLGSRLLGPGTYNVRKYSQKQFFMCVSGEDNVWRKTKTYSSSRKALLLYKSIILRRGNCNVFWKYSPILLVKSFPSIKEKLFALHF